MRQLVNLIQNCQIGISKDDKGWHLSATGLAAIIIVALIGAAAHDALPHLHW